jgi:benzylsuccinate CoA-transferase BbsF subunit
VTTRHLGLLGATVIKVETNTRLDTTRASTPFVGRPSRDRSGYFATHNNNKLSLTLDLNKAASRAVVRRLVEWADVVCENYSAGRLERWGLGFEVLRGWRADLILLRSSTWGRDGPYAAARANGVVLSGFAGVGHLSGWPDRPPLLPVEPYTDMISPWFAAGAVLAALIDRDATGRGAEIEVSQVECVLNFLGPELAAASAGRPPARTGPFTARPYPAGVFACAGEEEWLALSVRDAAEWGALCRVVPGLAGLEALDPEGRAAAAPFCFAALAAYFAGRAAPGAVHALQALGIPAARVAKPEDLYHDPQLAYRRHFVERPHPSMGRFAHEMPSFRFRDRPIPVERSPLIGEHSGLILKEYLGFSDDEIADLYADEVVN